MKLTGLVSMSVVAGVALLAGCASMSGSGDSDNDVAMACGQMAITVRYEDDALTLSQGDEHYQLAPVASASGARYQGVDNPELSFWNKGEAGMLAVGERQWPECVPQGGLPESFQARGNEPFWQVSLDGGKLTLDELGGQPQVADYEVTGRSRTGQTLQSKYSDRAITLDVAPQLCHDTMSGMAYPYQVRLTVDGERRQGCGGNPDNLLQGVTWAVEDINGRGVVDQSRVTINFLPDGRVAGKASCNNYMSSYQLSGEGLSFGQGASTMMACAPALMEQENRFLKLLGQVQGFDINPQGALVLKTADGDTLKAFAESSLTD